MTTRMLRIGCSTAISSSGLNVVTSATADQVHHADAQSYRSGFKTRALDVAAMGDRGVTEGFEEMALACARRAADDEVLVAVDPFQRRQRALGGWRDR